MSKSIKVSEEVYDQLERLRHKRETFSDVVERHIKVRGLVLDAAEILESAEKFWKSQRDREAEPAGRGTAAGVSTVASGEGRPSGGGPA